jgi:hypothetical protein
LSLHEWGIIKVISLNGNMGEGLNGLLLLTCGENEITLLCGKKELY